MTIYATVEQLTAYLGEAGPADAARLLDRASEVVDQALLTATYDVDATNAPRHADVTAALADATCAQVEFWLASDEEDDVLGPLEEASLGGMRLKPVQPTALAPRAVRHLRNCPLIRF